MIKRHNLTFFMVSMLKQYFSVEICKDFFPLISYRCSDFYFVNIILLLIVESEIDENLIAAEEWGHLRMNETILV